MGITFSSIDVRDLCKDELKAAQNCMKIYDYSREQYRDSCSEVFQKFRDCKRKCVHDNLFNFFVA